VGCTGPTKEQLVHSKIIAGVLTTVAVLGAMASPALGANRRYTARVTNAYYPLLPGMRWEYRGVKDGRPLRDVVLVTHRTERIGSVRCAVVVDRVEVDRRLVESTVDWFAQDGAGTVWYFGEATREFDRRGRVTSTEGSWRAGTDGARQGVYMPGHPRVGQSFAQEHYPGHAEDRFEVVSRNATISVPYGTFRARALMTEESTRLEPGVLDAKWYVKGIGQVKEATLKGGDERAELVSFRRR
jgi:hypothetical protein